MNLSNIKSKHDIPNKKEITIDGIWNIITSQESGLKSFNKRLISMEFSINSFKYIVKNLNLEVFKLKDKIDNLILEVESLKNKVSELEHCFMHHSNFQMKDLSAVNEVHERFYILMFNAPDKHDESIDNTTHIVNDLFQTKNLQFTVSKTKRLGNFHCKPNPILVELSSWNDVCMVLMAKSSLKNVDRWQDIWIGPDMTTVEREHINSLRNELIHKLKLGENNWIIKYVNSIRIKTISLK